MNVKQIRTLLTAGGAAFPLASLATMTAQAVEKDIHRSACGLQLDVNNVFISLPATWM